MKSIFIIYLMYGLFDDVNPFARRRRSCGADKNNATVLYEGRADIATYPWMGTFFYPFRDKKITSAVVLVTKQIVLGAANEIDALPKADIRRRSRVVLGQNCDAEGLKIRDYSFHPDFRRDTYSSLVLIQLEIDLVFQELTPICGPPNYFSNPEIYAMTPSKNCKLGRVHIRRMVYVNKELCRAFYRRTELDDKMFWAKHTTCARALSGGRCTWRGGTALVVKQDGRWSLLGFGLNGPGCQAPARFLDYGMHQLWVRDSVTRIGLPAISRIQPNQIVMRRTLASLQRFGPCDMEETEYEMYTDRVRLKSNRVFALATYNFTIIHNVEYSCIILRGDPDSGSEDSPESPECPENPRLHLRRWCAGPPNFCYGFQFLEIHFFLDIEFSYSTVFTVAAYGKKKKVISPLVAMAHGNSLIVRLVIPSYETVSEKIGAEKDLPDNLLWFHWRYYREEREEGRREPLYLLYYNRKYNASVDKGGYDKP